MIIEEFTMEIAIKELYSFFLKKDKLSILCSYQRFKKTGVLVALFATNTPGYFIMANVSHDAI